jgi:hypothetical protein
MNPTKLVRDVELIFYLQFYTCVGTVLQEDIVVVLGVRELFQIAPLGDAGFWRCDLQGTW